MLKIYDSKEVSDASYCDFCHSKYIVGNSSISACERIDGSIHVICNKCLEEAFFLQNLARPSTNSSNDVKPKTTMSKINAFMARTFDSKTKKFIKAGLIDEQLRPTQEGSELISSIVMTLPEVEKALLEYAEEKIEEQKNK